ncbi:cytochrome b561 and DOMON domain-containing protein [Canna indica]|uniref:Cytochrome b561 and DOMON domain-containing protein n=1 Tax=Canna indica TaxID=4628 RepID=A0AAQ3QTC2_9LILI|nr:cytochrome b561 and DOMON domain-containing protein [Canna indica]
MNLPGVFMCLFFSLLHHFAAQNSANSACGGLIISNGKVFTTCNSLPYPDSELHWTYHSTNNTVDIAYQASTSSSSWVA